MTSISSTKLPVSVMDADVVVNGSYGLFDVEFNISLDILKSTLFATLVTSVVSLIGSMRDAGTFLRELDIVVSVESAFYGGATFIVGATVWLYPKT